MTVREPTSLERKVFDTLDGMRTEMVSALSDLLAIPSVNPNYPGCVYDELVGGETEANKYMEKLYRNAGCKVSWVEREKGRANLVGLLAGSGGGGARSLTLNGHVDVVPPGDLSKWTDRDAFSGRVRDDKVFGRGATDMKGGLIAAAMAATALSRSGVGLKGDLILHSVTGEETGDHDVGVRAVVEEGFGGDAAIVGEPTGLVDRFAVAPVSGGLLWMTLRVTGKAGHNNLRGELVHAGGLGEVAGVNAVEKGVFLLTKLQELERQWGQSKAHPLFKPGWFSLHPGVIVGGPEGILVPFMISQYCTIEYSILYPPNEAVEDVKAEIEGFVQDAAALDPWLKKNPPEIEWRLHWPPYSTAPDHEIVKTLVDAHRLVAGLSAEADPHRVSGFAAVCDAVYFLEAGIPAVAYGPGSILQAHTADEYLAIDELAIAAKTYAEAAIMWCGVAG